MRHSRARVLVSCSLLSSLLFVAPVYVSAEQAESTVDPQSYAENRAFLERYTKVIELEGADGVRVAICPEYQGRIMTSTCAGPDGPSLGWVNYPFIRAGEHSPVFDNYGGEDRFWLGPEGGQYAIYFGLEKKQVMSNWFVPAGLSRGVFNVDAKSASECRLSRRVQVTNASETSFDVDVDRTLRLLGFERFAADFGATAADAARKANAKFVGFESENKITNSGPIDWEMQSGLLSIWSVGMFKANPSTVVVVPYNAGDEQTLGPVVETSYFGAIPPSRLQVESSAVLFRADGKYRAKLGIPAKRVRPFAGSVDLKSGLVTLVRFDLPPDPASLFYVNNLWKVLQKDAFSGDVVNSYNDGPAEPGAAAMGSFYEIETLSPSRPLKKGESISHTHSTFHLQVEPAALPAVVKATLGVELEDLRAFLDRKPE